MMRTTINLPISLHHQLQLEAKMRKTSVSDLIRTWVEQVLIRKQEAQTRRMYEALDELKGICKEQLGDVSSRINDILYGPQGAWKGRDE